MIWRTFTSAISTWKMEESTSTDTLAATAGVTNSTSSEGFANTGTETLAAL